jgi:hypothetical protein
MVGTKEFRAPLASWVREDVLEALKSYGVEPIGIDTGNIYACHNCLTTTERVYCPKVKDYIDGVAWNGAENTEKVRNYLRIIK